MKTTLLLISTLFFSGMAISQNNRTHQCAKRDAFSTATLKSNSLSLAQIAETEKYDVTFYALDLEMTNTATTLSGTGEIHGFARVSLDSVLFELFGTFNVSEIRLNGTPTPYSRVGSAIKVPVNLSTGQPFAIAVDYDGTPPTAATNPLGGSGMSNATSPSWGAQVTWSLSEPFSAYEWWPCKQSLKDKADSVSVKLTVPNNTKGGSNGVLENIVDLGNGTTRYEWMHNHPIDYYLISVAVGPYVDYSVYANPTGAPSPILIQNYIYDNPSTLPYFQNDIDETVDFLELFSDIFGMYPFADEKYGHCMAPLSGGMEHQTMTTQGFFVKWLTAHELGHQWWGDNITCASWADIWVNEGFASYSEYLMLENLYPAEKDQDMIDRHNNIMSNPNGSVWVEDSLNEGRIFSGRLTYDKGAAIVHTFRFIMNDDVQFFQALKDLQVDFADSTCFGIDIRDEFTAESGIDFTVPFNEWYFGEGYPTYSARWNTTQGDLQLEITHTTSSSTPTFTNPLEIQFSRAGAPDTTIRFDVNSNADQYTLVGMDNVTGIVAIDPNNWIINQVGNITEDPNFVASLSETELSKEIVYPNPTSGEFVISSTYSGTKTYRVLDMRGRLVESGSFESSIPVNIDSEKNGSYLVEIMQENGDKRIHTIIKK